MKTIFLALSAMLLASSCASYVNSPAARSAIAARKSDFSDPIIARAANARPAIRFPAILAISPQNHAARNQLRAMDADGRLDTLRHLPDVKQTTLLNSLITASEPTHPNNSATWNKADLIVREAAARIHADAVLLLSVETHITDGKLFSPLTTFTLGLFPNERAEIISTALAALIDVRTGYVYATAERSAGRTCHNSSWDELTRERTERRATEDAMRKLFSDFPALWRSVVSQHRR